MMGTLPSHLLEQKQRLAEWQKQLASLEAQPEPAELEARAAFQLRLEAARRIVETTHRAFSESLADYEEKRRLNATAQKVDALKKRIQLEGASLNKCAQEYRQRMQTILETVEEIHSLTGRGVVQGSFYWVPPQLWGGEIVPDIWDLKKLPPVVVSKGDITEKQAASIVQKAEAEGTVSGEALMNASLDAAANSIWIGHFS